MLARKLICLVLLTIAALLVPVVSYHVTASAAVPALKADGGRPVPGPPPLPVPL